MANPELGAKQICPNCQAKFYDLTRRPAVCPKCATAFDPEEVVRSRRTRSRVTPDYETDDGEAKVKEADAEGAEDDEDEVDDTLNSTLTPPSRRSMWMKTPMWIRARP